MTMRLWLFLGAVNGFAAVAAGAYGWHSLEVSDTGLRDIFAIGVRYQMWHALALLAVAWLASRGDGPAAKAVAMAADQIQSGGATVAIGGGVESITLGQGKMNNDGIINGRIQADWPGLYYPMGQTAEIVAERYNISREDQDRYALMSQQRYAKAQEAGWMDEEIAPMKVMWARKGDDGEMVQEEKLVDRDECNRPQTTLEGLRSEEHTSELQSH